MVYARQRRENAVSTEDDADGDAIPKFMDWLKDQPAGGLV